MGERGRLSVVGERGGAAAELRFAVRRAPGRARRRGRESQMAPASAGSRSWTKTIEDVACARAARSESGAVRNLVKRHDVTVALNDCMLTSCLPAKKHPVQTWFVPRRPTLCF